MKVKCFDEQHEDDLTTAINDWLNQHPCKVMDIKFSTSAFYANEEQIYCFSALLLVDE